MLIAAVAAAVVFVLLLPTIREAQAARMAVLALMRYHRRFLEVSWAVQAEITAAVLAAARPVHRAQARQQRSMAAAVAAGADTLVIVTQRAAASAIRALSIFWYRKQRKGGDKHDWSSSY